MSHAKYNPMDLNTVWKRFNKSFLNNAGSDNLFHLLSLIKIYTIWRNRLTRMRTLYMNTAWSDNLCHLLSLIRIYTIYIYVNSVYIDQDCEDAQADPWPILFSLYIFSCTGSNIYMLTDSIAFVYLTEFNWHVNWHCCICSSYGV